MNDILMPIIKNMRFVWSLGFIPIQKQSNMWSYFKKIVFTRHFLKNSGRNATLKK